MDVIVAGSAISLRRRRMRRRRSRRSFRRRCLRASSGADIASLDRVELGRTGRQEEWGDVVGQVELAGGVPSGSVEQQDGVGEVIASWKLAAGPNEAGCVRACFSALDRLAEGGPAYERDFGFRADFRAGLHCGPVVVGELGFVKKEIALIGDAMNTTQRIQDACREANCRVLVSAALLDRIVALPAGVTARALGPMPMRGKVALYALEAVAPTG
jgi:class 3 adenylate cyclase